ncbi:uncharacterized protein M437DRAFT_77470 [Aureobasidium melanogenum CBS 110374]|uniref:Uncharacterized protein n=1 Tax=Aureobasidium melanogenum (strain CBS 110374) TaxID=1043003 RepID=A0A074VIN5_AURM1|nr:uncharacterized protein M437DRAFT_77470 [Aureobasidium melanogenum CBS 110374]KEQ60398.1 hypothetical protein M437DRAFT_77470 [Aureobasidium melanogenum CBS 110374]
MAEDVSARDCIDSTIPVFPVARFPRKVLDRFFKQANAACRRCEYEEPQSTLMLSRDISLIKSRTEAPVDDGLLGTWPFERFSVQQIIDFAIQHLNNTDLSPTKMLVLDDITYQSNTCVLLSKNTLTDDPQSYIQVCSDFESSLVVLKTIETGCGDADSQLDTQYPGSDGVLRISVRDRL